MLSRTTTLATRGALFLAAVLIPAVALAAPEWEGDFETGDLSQWTLDPSNFGNQAGVTVVEDVVHEGQFAARVALAPGDVAPGGLTRNELEYSPSPDTFEDSERYYAIALRAGDESFANDWHSLWYWEGNPIFAPVMTLNAIGPQFQFRTFLGTEQELWTAPFSPDQWHEFVLHVRWSADPSVGFVELYYGGEIVVPMTNVQTMHQPGVPNFMHAGMLRSENIGVTEVIYIDGARSGETLEDVMPGVDGGTDDGGDDTSGDDAADDTDGGPGDGPDDGTDDGADGGTVGPGDGNAGSDEGSAGSTGAPAGETDSPGADGGEDDGGCACRSEPQRAGLGLLPLVLLAGVRRRARNRPPAG